MCAAPSKTASELLHTPVQFLKGVGPERAALLQRLGLHAAKDLLFFFPRDYQDLSSVKTLGEVREGDAVSIAGTIEEIDARVSDSGRSVLGILVRQGDEHLRGVWFNQPFLRQRFKFGQRIMLSGVVKRQGMCWEMRHPRVQSIESEGVTAGPLLPVYPLTEGLKQTQLRRIVQGVLELCQTAIDEVFPDAVLHRMRVWPMAAALPQVHFPRDAASLEQARRRFVYQELLVLQLALALRRYQLRQRGQAEPLPIDSRIDARIRRLFPFALTADQEQAIQEICVDLSGRVPMNRLLQGDVGSGKTVVAIYAMLLAVAHGQQAALMAPTEVLARQHWQTLQACLAKAQVRLALLTGACTTAERNRLKTEIAAGERDIVVGTQAMLHAEMQLPRLGLVVVDEQHKFGVKQRAQLRGAGRDPHYLVMTATPIPRTVAMTLYGDLDVSTLRGNPPGRQGVHTYRGDDAQREAWWEFFRRKLREGRQGFVIAPLVDGSDESDVSSVEQMYASLTNGPLEEFRVGLVHGRLSAEEKGAAMDAFLAQQTQVLVATSVVEVGVDIPNASLMTIENGERFGLAQLHQLRGRVRRGPYPGFVCVFANPVTAESEQRLQAFLASTDGFELAETDFRLRGPGDLFGTQQHGLPPLRIADVIRDAEILQEARNMADELIRNDPDLRQPEYARLKRMVITRYGQAMDLGDVG